MSLRRVAARIVAAVITVAGAFVAVPTDADAAAASPDTPAWVTAALADQYRLGNSLPLRDAPWWGTHNSFNSPKEMGPALSALDPNQKVKIVDQLDLGARQLELDVHWVPDLRRPGSGLYGPVVCHALSGGVGCTIEKPLGPVLDEVAGWLRAPAHRDQVLLVYLEDDLSNQTGYATAGQVFDWSHQHLEAQPRTYSAYPACGSDFTRAEYDSTMVRYFEELGHVSTLGGDGGFPITPAVAAQMQRCGVDLQSLDFLVPGDPRLPALVWSWAPNEPSPAGACTVQRADARWVSGSCPAPRRVACQSPDGSWLVPAASVPQADAAATCAGAGATFAVPRTASPRTLSGRFFIEWSRIHRPLDV